MTLSDFLDRANHAVQRLRDRSNEDTRRRGHGDKDVRHAEAVTPPKPGLKAESLTSDPTAQAYFLLARHWYANAIVHPEKDGRVTIPTAVLAAARADADAETAPSHDEALHIATRCKDFLTPSRKAKPPLWTMDLIDPAALLAPQRHGRAPDPASPPRDPNLAVLAGLTVHLRAAYLTTDGPHIRRGFKVPDVEARLRLDLDNWLRFHRLAEQSTGTAQVALLARLDRAVGEAVYRVVRYDTAGAWKGRRMDWRVLLAGGNIRSAQAGPEEEEGPPTALLATVGTGAWRHLEAVVRAGEGFDARWTQGLLVQAVGVHRQDTARFAMNPGAAGVLLERGADPNAAWDERTGSPWRVVLETCLAVSNLPPARLSPECAHSILDTIARCLAHGADLGEYAEEAVPIVQEKGVANQPSIWTAYEVRRRTLPLILRQWLVDDDDDDDGDRDRDVEDPVRHQVRELLTSVPARGALPPLAPAPRLPPALARSYAAAGTKEGMALLNTIRTRCGQRDLYLCVQEPTEPGTATEGEMEAQAQADAQAYVVAGWFAPVREPPTGGSTALNDMAAAVVGAGALMGAASAG